MNKTKFVLPETAYIEAYDITIRPYLTLEDIADIAESMIAAEDWCMMEVALNQGIVSHCVIDAEQFNGMDYETMKHCGFFKVVKSYISNLGDIDKYIEAKTSTTAMIGMFLKEAINTISVAADNLSNSDKLEDLMKQLQEIKHT